MIVDYRGRFPKQFRVLPETIQQKFRERLAIFLNDPFSPILHNHGLNHPYADCRSINVTGDYRAIYFMTDTTIWFIAIGTHSQLYN